MTPVPLELPLRPAEAAELANLIFDHAEAKPLSDELRNRLAARAAVLKLQTITPFLGSLERDPVHHSVYYLAVDGKGGSSADGVQFPLLLHMALAAAPTSSIYYKPLLIGRMRRPNGAEMVINAIPFGPDDRHHVETFVARIDSSFYPQPQGARTTITIEGDYTAAFGTFRAIQKRTGKNFAALAGDHHEAMRAAIRAGWRSAYATAADLTVAGGAVTNLSGREGFSRYSVVIPPAVDGLDEAEHVYQQIRQVRAAMKISRAFDLELVASSPMSPQMLGTILEASKERCRIPQLVYPGTVSATELEEMAAIARQFQITLSFRYRGESAETVRGIAKATASRLNYRVRNAAEAVFLAEHLL